MDLDAYRSEAEACISALDREYLLQASGRKEELDLESIYARHADLFTRAAVDALRAAGSRELLRFAVEGLIGRETRAEAEALALREATATVELDGRELPFRQAAVEQARADDPQQRAAIEAARHVVIEQQLEPLLRAGLERGRALAYELGWESMVDLAADLSGIDLRALGQEVDRFLSVTDAGYEPLVEPELREQLGIGFEALRRADLPAFFRAPALDRHFPADRLVASLEETLDGLGIDMTAGGRVHLDVEPRPKKSPRAFCAPVQVPDEVHLVIAPVGGREDFETLFHEAGHAEHFAHVDPALPVEARHLGDNSITEAFAFLFQHLTEDAEWLRRRLGIADGEPVARHGRASKTIFLRRYAAKLLYELDLHGARPAVDGLPATYARRLSEAVHVDWPAATWLYDVDPFFYSARYLRAWALETHLRRKLVERFGPAWFDEPGAGRFLRSLWADGQRLGADALLAERVDGGRLSFDVMAAEVGLG